MHDSDSNEPKHTKKAPGTRPRTRISRPGQRTRVLASDSMRQRNLVADHNDNASQVKRSHIPLWENKDHFSPALDYRPAWEEKSAQEEPQQSKTNRAVYPLPKRKEEHLTFSGASRGDQRGGKRTPNSRWEESPSRRSGAPGRAKKEDTVAKRERVSRTITRIKAPIYHSEEKDLLSQPIRLNRFLSNAGICSRREADRLIVEGKVCVNGEVVTTLGREVSRQDCITYQGKRVELERKVYILLNKPKNCLTTTTDPSGRPTVQDLVRNACSERIYPVGRLDRNTTGLLLFTNDGDVMSTLLHPANEKKKIYQATLDKPLSEEHLKAIAAGIELSDGPIKADDISFVNPEDATQIGIEIHSGRNRIVRRIFENLGYKVVRLDRVYYAGLTKKNLPRGRWRYLTEEEVRRLRMGNFE